MKRHTCIICGRKRYERYMKNVFLNSWACNDLDFSSFVSIRCSLHPDIDIVCKVLDLKSQLEIVTLKNFV